jgi:mRNA-degrading endonuclease YafQ of YafQ-DinJ toxin-antitoxin module
MIELEYAPKFLRQIYKLELNIREEALEKISLFRDTKNHRSLNVHKLHGRYKGRYAFYITSKIRILFKYHNPKFASFLAIDDHDIYKR